MGRGKCLHENKHTLEKNCDNVHDLYYSSYYDLNNSQNLSIYCKSLYRTIVLGKKPTYVHSQIQCKQAKLWKTSTALTYDKHLGVHWFLFTKILFAKKKKRWKTIVTWQSKSETTFSWWSSYKKDQIFDKNVNNINEKQQLHARLHGSKHQCGWKINKLLQKAEAKPGHVIITCILSSFVSFHTR